ncbi:tetratricopeptide repeat protein [bacterium]|nr:tetratricopeptide repeat protein [bacterium]
MKRKNQSGETEAGGYSILGWIVLLVPLSIFMFVMLFGKSFSFLQEQSASEAKTAAESLCRFGEADMRARDYQSAYARFMEAVKIKPDYPQSYIDLAQLYYTKGSIDQAIGWLQKAIELDIHQKDLVMNNLGLLYAQRGEYDKALNMFEQALSAGIKTEHVYTNIGNVYLSLKDYQKAADYYQKALDQKPSLQSVYQEMLKKAADEFRDDEEYNEVYKTAEFILANGIDARELEIYDEEIVSRFARTAERESTLHFRLGYAYYLYGDLHNTLKHYKTAVDLNPQSPQAQYRLGSLYLELREFENAEKHLRKAVEISPELYEARVALENVKRMLRNN